MVHQPRSPLLASSQQVSTQVQQTLPPQPAVPQQTEALISVTAVAPLMIQPDTHSLAVSALLMENGSSLFKKPNGISLQPNLFVTRGDAFKGIPIDEVTWSEYLDTLKRLATH